jgi:hypothetical protein
MKSIFLISTWNKMQIKSNLRKSLCQYQTKVYSRTIYRLVTSKLIERIVSVRIVDHLERHMLHDINQSAYRKHHSCETTLTAIMNDALLGIDRGEVTILILLDMSAAFDCVDHGILLGKISELGITGNALNWIEGYLNDRTQSVKIDDIVSPSLEIQYGVPQGSVLGPLLFTCYMIGLDSVLSHHGVKYKIYADDIQLYITTKVSSLKDAIERMEKCIIDLKTWLNKRFLHLNDSKTEAILLGSPTTVRKCGIQSIRISETVIICKSSVRDLGVIIDNSLTMDDHVSKVCRSAFSQLRLISRQNRVMNFKTRLAAVRALVFPHLNYCSSLLFGISKKRLKRIDRVISSSARLVLRNKQGTSGFMSQYRWLKMDQLVQVRLLSMLHSVLNTSHPIYLRQLLNEPLSQRQTRSSNQNLLDIPRCRTTVGERRFSVAASRLWNNLPQNIRELSAPQPFKQRIEELVLKDD